MRKKRLRQTSTSDAKKGTRGKKSRLRFISILPRSVIPHLQLATYISMNPSIALLYIASTLLLPDTSSAFAVVPSPDIVVWSQQHLITTASSTLPQLPNLFALYKHSLHVLPLQTQMATGAVLAIAGDTAAQALDKSRQFEPKRTWSFAAFDACYRAVQHIVYPPMKDYFHGQFLFPAISSILPAMNTFEQHHNQILSAAAEQALISQLVIIPLVYYPIFFAVTGAVQGLTIEQSIDRGAQSFIPLMQRNLLFWIPVQFGVFGWINDDAMQISVLIACGLIWTMILSVFAGAAAADQNDAIAIETIDDQMEVFIAPMIDTPRMNDIAPIQREMAYTTFYMSNSTGVSEEALR
jgi:Mpv17 / PMP22 family